MRVRRDVSSIPCRTASETWQRITDLITGTDSVDVGQLSAAEGVLATIITDEHLANDALVIEGVGPQLRVYCRYGLKAVEEGTAVDALTWNPTAGDWTMHVPCDTENLGWVTSSLAKSAPRIKAFDMAEGNQAEDETKATAAPAGSRLVVDWNFKG